ncbi:GerMN domain-containing protein [Kineosporia rhizophila]|uniref:GerMN domain-containing protein n=1 Tax=Kineosporia rhizophila TaxID=84633 RepID=UPI001E5FE757|nr:GerMN domain-containing protein [Kineosporia rhizophila]
MKPWCRTLSGLAVVLALASCGVPQDGQAQVLDADRVPYGLLEPGPTTSSAVSPSPVQGELSLPIAWVASDDALTLVDRTVPGGAAETVAAEVLQELAVGPSTAERNRGLRSSLPAGTDLRLTSLDGEEDVAVVEWPASVQVLAAEEVPLAVGQVVLSLTSVTGIRAVSLIQDGETVPAPEPGGSLITRPLTRADYEALLGTSAARRTVGGHPG